MRFFKVFVATATMAAGLSLLAVPTASAQTTNPREATANLSFSVSTTNGVTPVASIRIDTGSFCLASDGVSASTLATGTIKVISHEEFSSPCRHRIIVEFPGFRNCKATIAKTSETEDLSEAFGTTGARQLNVAGEGIVSFNANNPIGSLKAINKTGQDIQNGSNLSTLRINVSSCTLTNVASINTILLVNPEPSASMKIVFGTKAGCTPPGGATLERTIPPKSSQLIGLSLDCVWSVLSFDDASLSCLATLSIYRDTATSALTITSRQASLVDFITTANQILYQSLRVNTLVLHRSSLCSISLQVILSIDAPSEFIDSPVNIRIFPINSSTAQDCTDTNVTVTARTPIRVAVHSRGRLSSVRCRYAIAPQRFAGPLQLADSELAQQSVNFIGSTFKTVLDYSFKQLPINLHSVFPDQVFTTDDKISYSLKSPFDNCGSVRNGLGSLGAGIGVFREFQALPGTTRLLGVNADTSGGIDQTLIYSLPPTLKKTSGFGTTELNCKVVITANNMPRGCTVDDRIQEVAASSTTLSFDFYFIYTCGGRTGRKVVDPVTPPTPGVTSPATDEIALRFYRGWNFFEYNGVNNVTPASLITSLGGGINSIWIWDSTKQSWSGFIPSNGSGKLARITRGQTVAIAVSQTTNKLVSPAKLLVASGSIKGITLQPGLNLVSYKGPSKATGTAFNTADVASVHRWNPSIQAWEDYYRNGSRDTLATLNKGDQLFVNSHAPRAITVTY